MARTKQSVIGKYTKPAARKADKSAASTAGRVKKPHRYINTQKFDPFIHAFPSDIDSNKIKWMKNQAVHPPCFFLACDKTLVDHFSDPLQFFSKSECFCIFSAGIVLEQLLSEKSGGIRSQLSSWSENFRFRDLCEKYAGMSEQKGRTTFVGGAQQCSVCRKQPKLTLLVFLKTHFSVQSIANVWPSCHVTSSWLAESVGTFPKRTILQRENEETVIDDLKCCLYCLSIAFCATN